MADVTPQKIEQPAGNAAAPSGVNARVFTMPERYRHGAEGKMHEPVAKAVAAPLVEVKAPAVPAPKAPPKPFSPKKKSSATKKILIIGLIVLVLLAVGGYLLIQSTGQQTPDETEDTTPTSRPEPEEEEVEEEPESEPEEEEEPEATNPFPTATVPGVDTDSDGLTDVEENLVYGTNPKLPDTDSDGFLDGNEVYHRYNPSGTAPGTLLESGVVSEYQGPTVTDQNPALKYSLLYPSSWEIEPAADDLLPTPVTILATSGEKIQITLGKTGEPDIDPLAWYEAEGYTQDVEEMTMKNGYAALLSEDRLTVYIFSTDLVVILTMDTGIKATIDYLQTFQMILNSMEIL